MAKYGLSSFTNVLLNRLECREIMAPACSKALGFRKGSDDALLGLSSNCSGRNG